jgi:hypothetical protein
MKTNCSKLLNQHLFTNEGVLVKNIIGTKDASSVDFVHGDKKGAFCKIHKIKKYDKCSNMRCTKWACDTGHIRICGDDKTAYLTPLCGTCNNHNNTSYFKLKKDSRIVELIYVSTAFPRRPVFDKDLDKRVRICT